MRISDWSSDVCSSDLVDRRILVTRKGSTAFEKGRHAADLNLCAGEFREEARQTPAHIVELCRDRRDQRRFSRLKIGRASCRERVCPYVEISVVAVSLKKKIID